MQLLLSAWNDFSKETVSNCFQKVNISEKDETNVVNDVDDTFKESNESQKELQTKDPPLVPENFTIQDIAEADDQVITSALFLTDELILEEVSTMNKEANDGDDVNEQVEAPSSREVEHFLETLKKYSLFSKNRGLEIIFNFENLVIVRKSENYLNSVLLMISSAKIEKTFRYCNQVPFFQLSCYRKIYIDTYLQGFK